MRLARILSNEAVGLVLGGGGSRGISHVGVVTSLERHGIPVDIIGAHPLGLLLVGCMPRSTILSPFMLWRKSFQKNIFGLADVIRFDLPGHFVYYRL